MHLKSCKYWDARSKYRSYPKSGTVWFHNAVMRHKDTDENANSVGPDQTAP